MRQGTDESIASPSSAPNAIVRLELVAPPEIAPGESVQLTANTVKSDGSLENVTSQAQWTASSVPTSAVLTLTATGLATAGERGRALVTVHFAGLTANTAMLVLPKGTFRLTAKITEAGVELKNVAVTMISGIREGLTARTDAVCVEFRLWSLCS
ncbi:MAG TPA: hypothetical protein VEK56_11855 [Vicinamibacterales bacterium]|nr:hypothetical protein [Vicinamibacterales bacterium]